MDKRKQTVLFVCTGNMCRSPMAEYLLRHYFEADSSWRFCSAGLSAIDGSQASCSAIEVMREKGIDLTPHRTSNLTKDMADSAELILVMTEAHVQEIKRRFPEVHKKVFLLKTFNTDSVAGNIQDPVGLSMDVYRQIRDEIGEALLNLIIYLKSH